MATLKPSKAPLHMQNVSMAIGDAPILRDVSFTIHPGEMLALVGESGSGKSMSALSILGLQPESARLSGNVTIGDDELIQAGQVNETALQYIRGKRIGMVFQEPMSALNPLHAIGRQVVEAYKWHTARTGAKAQEKIAQLFTQVGLKHFIARADTTYPHQLSGGERQRLMIAQAIACNPHFLIADEPTTALDVHLQQQVLRLLKALQEERDMGVLLITHDLTTVRKVADKVAVMHEGRLVEMGDVADIFANPQHEYTKMLLASQPKGQAVPVRAGAKSVIECENLAVNYPIKTPVLRRVVGKVKAVKPLSFTLRAGETLGIVGESGSGKSSLGNALLRLVPSEGKVVFLSKDISAWKEKALRPLRANMQLVFQDPFASLNPRMTVEELISEGLRLHRPEMDGPAIRQAVVESLEQVGLDASMVDRFAHAFSGGQRQRIAIARAMVLKPDFVVLDEPTSALDMSVQSQVLDLLREFQAIHQVAYMLISHDLRVVKAMAHYVMVLKRGEVVEEGTMDALFHAPKHRYTKTLMHAAFDDYL